MSFRTRTALLSLALAFACDVDRTETLELLADPDLDPEVRGELAAELADDDADDLHADLDLAAAVDPSGLACFFCPTPQPDPATYTPIVKGPYVQVNNQGNTILFMQAAGSYIMTGATVTLQVPNTATTHGPYALSFDYNATQFRANVGSGFPKGSCRDITVTNPSLKTSAPVLLCR